MKHLDEYRDERSVRTLADRIHAVVTRPWTLMEICGGQTHTIMSSGLQELLPSSLTLVHGPGCPVCVTSVQTIDQALTLAGQPGHTLAVFGDMLRVPGSEKDLMTVKAHGGDVRIVYSPLDAVRIALREQDREVIFFAVGFETTAPATALAVMEARRQGVDNFSVLCAHVLVPPAIEAILSAPGNTIQGLLAAGHVCTVTGYEEYVPIAQARRVPIVVTGFEPVDILRGILMTVELLEEGRFEVHNAYGRSVLREGNNKARQALSAVFDRCDRAWRGLGIIPSSGLTIKTAFATFDAGRRFSLGDRAADRPSACRAGEVLRGILKPNRCPAFAAECSPEHPLGAPMVSSEGACAAYYRYRRFRTLKTEPMSI